MKKVANITVAIPTLDRASELARCLEAVLKGNVLPAEVIIVNQGGRDRVEALIKRFQKEGTTAILHYSQSRSGLSAARNLALQKARCHIIAFTDDDCVPAPDWIAHIERTLISSPSADGMTGSILPLGEAAPGYFPISLRTGRTEVLFQGRTLPWQVGSGGNFAIRQDWLRRIGGYDERLGAGSPGKAAEDTDLFYQLLRTGAIIRYKPDAIIYHERQDAAHLIHSFWSYSHGIGAFVAKHFRKGDLYAAYILAVWLFWLFWRTGASILRRNWIYAGEGWLSLKGCSRGLAYGFKLR
jgi:GT2 family glycosyltransferase